MVTTRCISIASVDDLIEQGADLNTTRVSEARELPLVLAALVHSLVLAALAP